MPSSDQTIPQQTITQATASPSNHITNNIQQAAFWLKQGKIIAYPTESVWGLGCDPFNKQAIKQLLSLKNRPINKGLIVITPHHHLIGHFLVNLPKKRYDDILVSWQCMYQATTWLFALPTQLPKAIPIWLTGDHNSLAIRQINHPTIAQLCKQMDNPYQFLVSTSCNTNKEPPAKDFQSAYAYFGEQICYLLGDTQQFDKPSQIKDSQTGQVIRI